MELERIRCELTKLIRNNGFNQSIRRCDMFFDWSQRELYKWSLKELLALDNFVIQFKDDIKFKSLCNTLRSKIVKARLKLIGERYDKRKD